MPSDKTRTSDDIRQGYKEPVMQQGRVILDRDFNALRETLSGALEADALDIVGPCGTPDDGFAISLPPLSSPLSDDFDFLIGPGTMYVGCQRAVFPSDYAGQTVSYRNQPDWLRPDDILQHSPPVIPNHEFVFLHLCEQEVGAIEDSDLKDVALGGPDTTQRLRLMRRVKRMEVSATDCASALEQAEKEWDGQGFAFDPKTMRLVPQATLQVSFAQSEIKSDPCDPVATGGYLGAENQLIRVQISDSGNGSGGPATLLWGYDNASFIYRVTVYPDGKTLQLNSSPVDAFHIPRPGQIVEILRTATVLACDPDQTNPQHSSNIVRCVAEATGEVRQLTGGYDLSARTVSFDVALPREYVNDSTPVFLRIWQAQLPFNPAGDTVELTDPVGQGAATGPVTTGLKVAIEPTGQALPVGAYWLIAVRPSTPQAVYPECLLIAPQPPDGPRQWACSLAVLDWTKAFAGSPPAGNQVAVQDCREKFDNLVDLTKRKLGGCCSVQIRPEDLREGKSLQQIIDQFAGPDRTHREVTVCLLPGKYELTAPLVLERGHSNFTIEGCHDGVVIEAARGSEAAFLDGLFVLLHADNVTLRGLRFHLPLVPFRKAQGLSVEKLRKNLASMALRDIGSFIASIGVRALHCARLEVQGCLFRYALGRDTVAEHPEQFSPIFAAGLLTGSECWGLTVEKCRFLHDDDPLPEEKISTVDLLGIVVSPSVVFAETSITRERLSTGAFVPALLQDASLRNNTFSGISLAVMVIADAGLVKLEGNLLRACRAGFFLTSTDFAAASPLIAAAGRITGFLGSSDQALADSITTTAGNALLLRARVLASIYPVPANFDLRRAVAVTAAEDLSRTAAAVEGIPAILKHVSVVPAVAIRAAPKKRAASTVKVAPAVAALRSSRLINAAIRASFTAGPKSSPLQVAEALIARVARQALLVVKNRQRLQLLLHVCENEAAVSGFALEVFAKPRDLGAVHRATDHLGSAVILSANRLQSTNADTITVQMTAIDQCTVTGNMILNEWLESSDLFKSLWLLPLIDGQLPPRIAVTGNVLQGRSNLSSLSTGKPSPVDNWDAFNATF